MTALKLDDYKDLKLQLDGLVKPGSGFFLAATNQHNFCARPGKSEGHRPAEFAGSADHDGGFTLQ